MSFLAKTALCVVVVLGSATIAVAQDTAPPLGTAYFLFTNLDNGGLHPTQDPNFTNPNATTDGALWIKTGTPAPVWLSQDVNLRLDWRPTPTSPWTTITTLLLQPPTPPPTYANGSGWGDVTALGYPGYWLDNSGQGNPSLPMPHTPLALSAFYNLPAMVLQVPEPSTIGLLLAGAIGLLAYALRKHRAV